MSKNKLESADSSTDSPRPVCILALCDSPTVGTGFGRVAANLLSRWAATGATVHCWGINFEGWNYDKSPVKLFPGGSQGWNLPRKLTEFLNLLASGNYTHVWLMNDADALSVGKFPAELKRVCREKNIRSMFYYPVDAPMERDWLAVLDAVDVAATYTRYGRDETRKALGKSLYPIEVIPHGIDTVFHPIAVEDRAQYRKFEIQMPDGKKVDFVQPDDFLIVNVNKNEWRKDPLRSLEILKGLRALGVPAKLVLRMAPYSAMGGVHLELTARQMGLTYGKEWCHIGEIPDVDLCGLYNAANLYLTTTLGEGWGLGVTEAMACHCPVAMPNHTSLTEIGAMLSTPLWLPLEDGFVCGADTRLRRRVDLGRAVPLIAEQWHKGGHWRWSPDQKAVDTLLNWDVIAKRMLGLLLGGAK